MKNARGFTLVEILVVVVIITVLATIGTLTYGGFQSQSRDKKREANANVIADSLERYYEKNGEYPSIADVTSTNAAEVKSLLNVSDTSALVMPNAPANTLNSLKPPTETLNPGIIAYEAKLSGKSDNAVCENKGGGCDSFILRWLEEGGDVQTIDSRNKDRSGTLQAPANPIITASIVSGTVVGKVTHDTNLSTICPIGSPEYKIIANTSDVAPNWASTSWQPIDTKVISNPTPSTRYYFYAMTRCISSDGGEAENANIAKDELYYTIANMVASWDGTTAVGTISSGTSSTICESTQIAEYLIQTKIDTTTAGTWTPSTATWSTSNNARVLASGTNPRKISFKGQVRCNDVSPATTGTPYPESNIDSVISAPATPNLQLQSAGPPNAQWTWQSVVCPIDTAPVYKGSFGGNYPFYPSIGIMPSSPLSYSYPIARDGFTYEFGLTASCGLPSSKILSSPRATTSSITHPIQELTVGAGRFFTDNYSGSENRVKGATTLSSDSAGYCPTGLNRYVTAQFAHNKTGADTSGWNTYRLYEYWPGGNLTTLTGHILYATAREDHTSGTANSNLEFRADVYCQNPYTGARGPQRLIDRYGILRIYGQNEGGTIKPYKYRIWCNGQSINDAYLPDAYLWCEGNPYGAIRVRSEPQAWYGGF